MNENNMQNLRKSEKKRKKFNIIDFLLIVFVLVIIAALVYVFLPSSIIKFITADTTTAIQYAVEIIGVDEEYIDNIAEGNVVNDSVSKSPIGTVVAVDSSTQYRQLQLQEENGEMAGVLSPVQGKRNVIVTISADAYFTEGEGYSVNGTRIAVGEKINLKFPNYYGDCEAYCISVPKD